MHNLKHFIVIIFTISLIIYPLVSCANEPNKPQEINKLPWSVFPICNDIEWTETNHNWYSKTDGGVDVSISTFYITTTSARQISENRAELYSSTKIWKTETRHNLYTDEKVELKDSSVTEPKLGSCILIEDNIVYCLNGDEKKIMFDFNVKVGDVLDWLWKGYFKPGFDTFYVNSIDTILVGNDEIGYEYKKQYFICNKLNAQNKYPDTKNTLFVVEGIGCVSRTLSNVFKPQHHDDLKSFGGMYYKGKKIEFELVEPSNMRKWLMGEY